MAGAKPNPIFIYKLGEGSLFAMPRPAGGIFLYGAIDSLAQAGFTLVVSLLDSLNTQELGLFEEEYLCKLRGLDFLNLPIRDRSVPDSSDDYLAAVNSAYHHITAGGVAVAHCWAGIGRTGLFNASLLVRHGLDPGTAFNTVSRARGSSVPDTQEQIEWVYAHHEQLQALGP
ncbi:MAG: hypothetical protein P8J55_12060 [Pseudomonadales bacterium]|nr:hypothetical protein [Pseudomonadales bacterium]